MSSFNMIDTVGRHASISYNQSNATSATNNIDEYEVLLTTRLQPPGGLRIRQHRVLVHSIRGHAYFIPQYSGNVVGSQVDITCGIFLTGFNSSTGSYTTRSLLPLEEYSDVSWLFIDWANVFFPAPSINVAGAPGYMPPYLAKFDVDLPCHFEMGSDQYLVFDNLVLNVPVGLVVLRTSFLRVTFSLLD